MIATRRAHLRFSIIYLRSSFSIIPDHPDTEEDETTSFVKQPSIIEQKAYRDTWGRGLDSYLQWFYETAVLLRDLLAEEGSIYVHRDFPAETVIACEKRKAYIAAV